MAPPTYQVLSNTRINGVMQGLLDPRTLPNQLVWSRRVLESPADDAEILARFIGYIQIADLIADDQRAAVYEAGKFQFQTTNIPNLKIGQNMTQAMLNQLQQLGRNGGIQNDRVGLFAQSENRLLANLRAGVAMRKESLIIGMLMDSFSYDRLGIKITNGTWGMPADLKITVATPWSNAGAATPVEDIRAAELVARVRYGAIFNRISMSTPAFRLMIATTEFQNKARMWLAPNVSYVNLSLSDLEQQRALAQNVLGMEIELYDTRYWTKTPAGDWISVPLWDLNAVVLSNSGNDGDRNVMDFANGIVTESIVADIVGMELGGVQYGPIAYATAVENLNPPQVTYWAVQRGFPRKHLLQSTACLRVGTVTDTISTAAPF
jgi:hypothetical protein